MTDTFETVHPHASDENPSTDANRRGPSKQATHPLAIGRVQPPGVSVDGFVREFLE